MYIYTINDDSTGEEEVGMDKGDGELMAREALHRVGNELAVAAAALRVARRRGGDDPAVAAAIERIEAAAQVNALLSRRATTDVIDLGAYLTALHLPLSRLGTAAGVAVHLEAGAIRVFGIDPRHVGMIVYELVMNAIRHADRDDEGIRVSLSHRCGVATIEIGDGGGTGDWTREGGQGGGIVDDLAARLGGTIERWGGEGCRGSVLVTLPALRLIPPASDGLRPVRPD